MSTEQFPLKEPVATQYHSTNEPSPTTTTTAPPPPATTTTTHIHVPAPATAPAPAPTPAPTPAPASSNTGSPGDPALDATWYQLFECESAGYGWGANTGNGYYGGLQFALGTWQSVGGVGYPHQASAAEQILRGRILQARSGWGQWPACTRSFGWR